KNSAFSLWFAVCVNRSTELTITASKRTLLPPTTASYAIASGAATPPSGSQASAVRSPPPRPMQARPPALLYQCECRWRRPNGHRRRPQRFRNLVLLIPLLFRVRISLEPAARQPTRRRRRPT